MFFVSGLRGSGFGLREEEFRASGFTDQGLVLYWFKGLGIRA